MKFTVADLLDQLSAETPTELATLAKTLKLTNKSERQNLDIALQALKRLGVVDGEGEDLLLGSDSELIEARLRCSSKGFCFAIRDDGGDDIYIRDHQLNHAWNGDRVLVRVTREGGRRRSPEGGVQCILERSTSSLLGQVERLDNKLVALPLDDRLLTSILLPDQDDIHLPEDPPTAVVEVHIDRYPVAQCSAEGHVARPLPLNGGPSADRDLLLTKAGLQDRPAAPRGSAKAPAAKGRVDLTEQPCLLLRSWTVEDAPGLPAVHVVPHAGGCRLWVHAPTVAERLGMGSSVDLWLRERGEAICLAEVWQPLLNSTLSKSCRFHPGEVAEAVTVRIDLSADGEATDWEFMLSMVQPQAWIDPTHLKALAERKPKARTISAALKPVKDHLGQLETLIFCAGCVLQQELKQGAIELQLRPPKLESIGDLIWSDPTGLRHRWLDTLDAEDPQSILQPLLRAAHRAWGAHATALGLPGIQVLSGEPDISVLNDVAKTAVALELPLELDDEGSPTATELMAVFADAEPRRVLEQQLSHALPEQIYGAFDPALGTSDSTDRSADDESVETPNPISDVIEASMPLLMPWTCAGLHYGDLANQQILVTLLTDGKDRPTVRHKQRLALGQRGCAEQLSWQLFTATQDEKIHQLCNERFVQRLNSRRRQVQELERDLISMLQARCAEPLVDSEIEGQISGVQSYGFFVEVGPMAVEGLVHVSSLNDDWYEYRSRQNRLVGRKNRRSYQLGDKVHVRVIKVDVLRNQIDLEVIPDPLPVEPEEPSTQEPLPVTLDG